MDLTQHMQTDELLILQQPIHGGVDDMDECFDESLEEGATGVAPSKHAKTSVGSAVFSYLCTCVGAGVLSLPGALQYCGWSGLILMAIVALMCNETAKMLCACMFSRPGVMLRSYEDIGEQAYGKTGRRIVALFQVITLFGVCTIFLILIGGNMNTLVSRLTLHDWIFVFAALLIPIAWLKTMNEVSVLAIFGVLASLFVAGVVVVKGFVRAADPHVDVEYEVFNGRGLPNAVNIIVFSFGGHSVLPNIVSHVERPRANYARVSSWSYLLIALIYGVTAAGGYAGWGTHTEDKVLDNMDEGSIVVKLAYAFITAHVVLAYPIPLNPMSLAIERSLGIDQRHGLAELVPRVVSRTCLVLLTVLVASVVPYFGDILSLVSALSIVVVVFVLPPLFYYRLFQPVRRFGPLAKAKMLAIVAFGVAASGIGIYFAIKDLVHDIRNNPNPFDDYF